VVDSAGAVTLGLAGRLAAGPFVMVGKVAAGGGCVGVTLVGRLVGVLAGGGRAGAEGRGELSDFIGGACCGDVGGGAVGGVGLLPHPAQIHTPVKATHAPILKRRF
jgi:hypothetical protein